ncbi:MAG: P1 family peptidase [Acidobacteriia bacterium]|nr:P1 family peptidase [Terriglobia bacterium]
MNRSTVQLIPGLALGHYTDAQARTGCTVLVCEQGAVPGVDIRGSASGTREIASCQPGHLIDRIHAIALAGGSAFGLAAADGVMEYLEQRGIGFDVGVTHVPIVASAIVYDLSVGNPWVRPDKQAGFSATASARSDRVEQGAVGAGTGATVGKLFGAECASPGGFGFSMLRFAGTDTKRHVGPKRFPSSRKSSPGNLITVQAFAVVNAFGDVVDPRSGRILAGTRVSPGSKKFADTVVQMKRGILWKGFKTGMEGSSGGLASGRRRRVSARRVDHAPSRMSESARASRRMLAEQMPEATRKMFEREGADTASRWRPQSTTLVVVATDAAFDKIQMQKIAQMAQNGLARVLRPAHTLLDGDTVFALSVFDERHSREADVNVVGEVAAEAAAEAILAAVRRA